ncbi:hypothetical protein [Mycolicibacterium sp.]|uniref:hypothetical protein n=1 Tax=Mycolicibacterium sp. TaxID=2320850 RepID=UPI00355F2E24
MKPPNSIIDPSTAEPGRFLYVVALKDDDWEHWETLDQAAKYNGGRRSTGRWNLRDLATGSPVDWDYADDEVLVLEELG